MNAELDEISEFYRQQLSSKDAEIKKLRSYISEIESSESGIRNELARQLSEKGREMQKAVGLLKSSSSAEKAAKIQGGRIKAKNSELGEASEFYRQQLSSKDAEIKKLRSYISKLETSEAEIRKELSSQLSEKDREMQKAVGLLKSSSSAEKDKVAALYISQLKAKDAELEKLRSRASEFQRSEKYDSDEFTTQLSDKDSQIRRMMKLLRLKEAENSRMSLQLEERMKTEREYVEKIKNAIERKGKSTNDVIKNLSEELDRKNSDAERLRNVLLAQEKVARQLDNQSIQDRRRIEHLEAFLEEKELLRQKLEQNFTGQLREKDRQMDELARDLKKQVSRNDSARISEELASLKAKLSVKESEMNEITGQYAEIREQNNLLSKRLQERQRLFVESESTYNRLINTLQEQHEGRVRELLHRNAEHSSQLKAELEKLKAEMIEKAAIASEKGSRIDETLLQFAETARKLIELKGPEFTSANASIVQLKQKEDSLNKRESELSNLLGQATGRIQDALRKEAEVAKREALLMKEQEALGSELDVLKKAGMEIGRDRSYLKQKIEQYSLQKPQEKAASLDVQQEAPAPELETFEAPAAEEMQPAEKREPVIPSNEKGDILSLLRHKSGDGSSISEMMRPEKAPASRKGVFEQAKPKSRILPKPPLRNIQAKVDRPKIKEALVKQASKQDAFPEASGYGELDEIKSIISIGLQHGDSTEQIRASLENSGYSKKNIELAFSETTLV